MSEFLANSSADSRITDNQALKEQLEETKEEIKELYDHYALWEKYNYEREGATSMTSFTIGLVFSLSAVFF